MPMIEPVAALAVHAERAKTGDGMQACALRLKRKNALEALAASPSWSEQEQRELHAELLRKIIAGEY